MTLRVDSAFERLQLCNLPPYLADDWGHFSTLVRQAFSHGRNNLRKTLSTELVLATSVDRGDRAEQLSGEHFAIRASPITLKLIAQIKR